jgi:hypothetical protein
MSKTFYEAPSIKKVHLEIKNAVLGACHSSPNITPKAGVITCSVTTGCYNPPAGNTGNMIGDQFGN